ncbi:hypothetical protein, conserved [Plasmodium gonderi]|uniref:Uncharacterized protein n=1 Tax=Plasmodium gonderi TaxID=77519 RepID=A0A1Y1JLZ5_PLAGO|nr:hypothetical protein, conserved [Plasmodium gonderi]GAW83491.1 hypothetical protein, conserved [Plasmodium gonderi]
MDCNLIHDFYKTLSCFKTIRKINTFVKDNKEKASIEELKILNEKKYLSHSIAIVLALGIHMSFRKLKRSKIFIFRPLLPDIFGLISSCSFLYLHALHLSRNNISKFIQLNLKESDNKGICNYVDEMYKKYEPNDYLNLMRKSL